MEGADYLKSARKCEKLIEHPINGYMEYKKEMGKVKSFFRTRVLIT